MKHMIPLMAVCIASPALADETRQLDAHEHGVGALNIAIEANTVAMEFHAPGADIVGFEYAAENSDDRAAIDAAVATLARPLDLFLLPAAAECSVTQASAQLESEMEHHDQDKHAEHDEHEHSHDDHDDHDDHAAKHDDHDDHAETHEEHAGKAAHTEFHAEYVLTCADPSAITSITFAYFDTFENAREIDIQIVTGAGAQAFEVERGAPVLDLRSLF